MDPLSLAASIIAVLGAVSRVGHGLKEISSLRHAPDALLQLENEVANMQLILHTVDPISRNDGSTNLNEHEYELVCNTLGRVKEALLGLERLIAYTLTKLTNAGNAIDHIAWLRSKNKIHRMKEKIRNAKNDLLLATSIISS